MLDVDLDEHRWAEAESVLDRMPTERALQRQRWRHTTTWVLVVSLMVLATATGLLVAALVPAHHTSPAGEVPEWRDIAGLVIVIAGVGIGVAGIVLLVRTGMWGARWRSPTAVLTRRQRRALARQVMGRAAADERRLRLARDLAQRLVSYRVVVVTYLGLAIGQVGQAVESPSRGRALWAVSPIALYVAGSIVVEVYARRGQRFLRTHPSGETASA